MHEDLTINAHIAIPATELWFEASRASGPGGQNVNKTNSRVTLRWNINTTAALNRSQKRRVMNRLSGRIDKAGILSIHVQTARSQLANRETARERLAELIAAALVVPKARKATKPSRGAKERRLKAKKSRSQLKSSRRYRPDD
mgnify:CR=1 FL=1